ncbi:S-adenosyl-L-methionine-dependent methyltransferase [Rhypophila decipiens]
MANLPIVPAGSSYLYRQLQALYRRLFSGNSKENELGSALTTLESLQSQIKSAGGDLDRNKRASLLKAARILVQTLEKPEEAVFRQSFETHTHSLCIRLAVDLRIFHILVARDGQPITSNELAAQCAAEELFIARIMRILTSLSYASESGSIPPSYLATPLSKACTIPHLEAYIVHTYEHAARATLSMPAYFKLHGYKSPTDGSNGPFQYALGTKLPYFDYLHADPVKSDRFNICMNGNKGTRRHWVDWYPVDTLLESFDQQQKAEEEQDAKVAAAEEQVFLVDMGGGNGKHLQVLLRKFPQVSGHLVLQDLPGTIKVLQQDSDDNLMDKGIRPMVHDIFSPQPLKGAKTYYTHFLLHDFPDDKCREMLQHVAASMTPGGYSRLLLNEIVLPSTDCASFFAAADITMMAVLAGMQRTKEQWVELVESAGLTVTQVWKSPDEGDFEGIVEAIVGNNAGKE